MVKKGKNKYIRNRSKQREENGDGSRFNAGDILNVLIIFALVLLFFLPAVIGAKVFFGGDVMTVYNPYQAINAEQLAQGKMPLWTDRFFCGFPLFAESQGALFYPPTRLAYYLLPSSHAFTLDALIHFFLAGLFMYILARYLGQRPLAALFAGTAFAFSGLLCSLIINFTIFRSAVWIPIIFYFSRRSLLESGLRWTFLMALSIVFQMMGGSLQVTGITILVLAIDVIYVVLASLAKGKFVGTFIRVTKIILAVGFAVGLYAFQLWPTQELTNIAQRGVEASYETASSYSFPPQHLIDMAIPAYYGDPGRDNALPGVPQAPNFFAYIGVIGLALALYALGNRKSGILWLIAVVFVILSLGPVGKLFDIVYYNIPFFDKFRAPDRFLMVFVFCAALLAGFGADRIIASDEERSNKVNEENNSRENKRPKDTRYKSSGIYLFAMLILIFAAVIGLLPWLGRVGSSAFDTLMSATLAGPLGVNIDATNFAQYEAWRNSVPSAILYFIAFAISIPIINLLFGRAAGGRGLVLLFLIFNCLDLALISGQNHNCRLISGDFFAKQPKSVEFIKAQNPNARIYSYGKLYHAEKVSGKKFTSSDNDKFLTWYQGGWGSKEEYFRFREIVTPNLSAYFGLYDAGGFASLFTEDFYLLEGEVIKQLSDVASGMSIPSNLPNGHRLHLLIDIMAVDYVITSVELPQGERFEKVYDGDVLIYRNKMALPRAFVVHPAKVYNVDYSKPADLLALANSIGRFDFEGNIILPRSAGIQTFPDNSGITYDIVPKIVEPGRVMVGVKIDRPGVFVLADSYYPGWHAKVDGRDAEILKTNFYFRGIVLNDPGNHEIEFTFKPQSFDNGVKVSALSFILFLLLAIGKGLIDRWYYPPKPDGARGKGAEYDDNDEYGDQGD
jgi:hypothetical protein